MIARATVRRMAAAAIVAVVTLSTFAAPRPGDIAPEFAGRTFEGESISISAYRGKVVVVSFWASWCVPCRKELPILEGIQQTAGKELVQVVAINIEDIDTFRKLARSAAALQMTLASDTAKEAQAGYGVRGIPHMVIIGKTGRIMRIHRGYTEEGVDAVVKDLNRALAE